MTADVVLSINATFGKDAAAKETTLEAKVKASMKAVLDGNWMSTSQDELFRAGVAGALLDVGNDSEDGKRIVASVDALRRFSAFLNASKAGLDVDVEGLLPKEGEAEMLPLMGWWHEVVGDRPERRW